MTRAPLPGKLPEWPEWQEDDLDYAGYYHELAICWESRARLAVKRLTAIHMDYTSADAMNGCAKRALEEIGPLPEEDRT